MHRNVALPAPDSKGIKKLSRRYVEHYLRNKKGPALEELVTIEKQVIELIEGLTLGPRQIQEAFRIFAHWSRAELDKSYRISWAVRSGALFLACLSVCNETLVSDFGHGRVSAAAAKEFIEKTLGEKRGDWWVRVIFVGLRRTETNADVLRYADSARSTFSELSAADERQIHAALGQFAVSWDMLDLPYVYRQISEIKSFLDEASV